MEETKGQLRKITFFRELDKEGIYYSEVLNSIFLFLNIEIFLYLLFRGMNCIHSGATCLQEHCMWKISVMDRACPDLQEKYKLA